MTARRDATVIRAEDLDPSPKGTITFEGEAYGLEVSMFLIDYHRVGEGPDLHKHPYAETWVVRSGNALFAVDGQIFEAGAGDIVVAPPDTPHMFKNVGPGNLEIICIHPSSRFVQEDLGLGG